MNVIMLETGRLKPYKNNPRKNDGAVDAVANSIKEFGFKVPVIIDKNNEIVAGHTRAKAAQKLGLSEIPCIIADDLTDEQIKAFRLADNKTHELAEWDFDLLNVELDGIFDIDMADFGFDLDGDIESTESQEDNFDIELNIPAEPVSKVGDIYQLGKHRLMCGDCTDEKSVAALMNDRLADLIVTDPPYNVDYEGNAGKIKNDKMCDYRFYEFLHKSFRNMYTHSNIGSAAYIFHADSEGLNFRRAFKDAGFTLKQCLIWVKNHFVLGRQDYQWKHEPILYGWIEGRAHLWAGDRKQTTVLEFDRPMKSDEHPTMKPISILSYLIQNSSETGNVVLDLFGGSGSTLIACEQLNRVCLMMELDPKYVDVSIKRWENFTGQKAMKII